MGHSVRTTHARTFISASASLPLRGMGIKRIVANWVATRRSRIALSHLPDYMLKDIGIDRDQAFEEAGKPFWR